MVSRAQTPDPVRAMTGHDPRLGTSENYRRFASEARDRSPAYGELAEAVADDAQVLAFLEVLPATKRQPNLLFGAACHLLGVPPDIGMLRRLVRERADELAAVMRTRRTQTNEAARCATLLPALAQLPEPLALLEVGASAGLTLLPDHYSYDYAGHTVRGADPHSPTLACQPYGPVPLPTRVPEIAWRAGLDLNPLDADDPDDARWLASLLWPGEGDRHARLRAALETARRHPVQLQTGDLVDDLAATAADAPPEATLVVYHSAVLAYVDTDTRRAFADAVGDLGAVWLSNEAPDVVRVPGKPPSSPHGDSFVLVRGGRDVLASTDSHGTWVAWAH